MKLTELMKKEFILPDLNAADKEEAIRKMTDQIANNLEGVDREALYRVMMDREKLNSTGIGSGIAIPHAKFDGLDSRIAAFARSRQGIPFDAIDGKPVHLIFMIVGPKAGNEAHLKALARISKFLHDTTFRDRLLTADTAERIYDTIDEKDSEY